MKKITKSRNIPYAFTREEREYMEATRNKKENKEKYQSLEIDNKIKGED